MSDLSARLQFFSEADRLKGHTRATWIRHERRFETVAEHVWHTTLLAMLLADTAPEGTDHNHVRDLLTVHDLVEVYAGDVPIWDQHADDGVDAAEMAAGERLMLLLPADQRDRFDPMWREFQAQETIESRFARAIDALHPMIVSWFPPAIGHDRAQELTPTKILERKLELLSPFPQLWQLGQWLVLQAVDQGFIPEDDWSRAIRQEVNDRDTE